MAESIAAQRRRLSVGVDVAAPKSGGGKAGPEADRGLLQELKAKKVLDAVEGVDAGGGAVVTRKRASLVYSSQTDKDLKRRQSYEEKDNVVEGIAKTSQDAKSSLNEKGRGIACKKGMKPESPNQDSFSVLDVEGKYAVYGVYDGHGPFGHDVSNFVKDNLVKLLVGETGPSLETDPEGALVYAFEQCHKLIVQASKQKEIDASMSGSTVTVAFHNIEKKFFVVAHAGDSRAVLATKAGKGLKATPLTEDHKPNLPEEKKRIEKNGGRVVFDGFYNHRVFAFAAAW